jgi:hypothetical protein
MVYWVSKDVILLTRIHELMLPAAGMRKEWGGIGVRRAKNAKKRGTKPPLY